MKKAVQEIGITHGADLQIELSYFSEDEPIFAYVDDTGDGVEPISGLEFHGRMVIDDLPDFMWLNGPRDCILLKVNPDGKKERRVQMRSLGVGEFCLEIYHIKPDRTAEVIYQNEYCFK